MILVGQLVSAPLNPQVNRLESYYEIFRVFF
jgi:hypothetical protein